MEIEYLLTMLWFPKMETTCRLCHRRDLRTVLLPKLRIHLRHSIRPLFLRYYTLYQELTLLCVAIDYGILRAFHWLLCILLLSLLSLHTGRALELDNMAD
jgi:hypothetical protein